MATSPRPFKARFALPAKEEATAVDNMAVDRPDGPMTEEQLGALVDAQINDAKNYQSSDLVQMRENALKFYEGEVDFGAPKGRSSVVSRDLADTHGLILPGIMRVFLATDNVAIYNPQTVKDEAFAQQATDYVNYVVMRECNGYSHFRSAFHDGLLMGNGILKHWWDETPEYSTEDFCGLSDDAFTMLAMDPDVDIIEHSEYDDPSWVPPPPMPMLPAPPMGGLLGGVSGPGGPIEPMPMGTGEMPEPQPPKLHDGRLKRCTSYGRLRVMSLAPEDLVLGRGVVVIDETDERLRFIAHRWLKTRSKLIEEGFDEDIVESLPAYSSAGLETPEALARDKSRLFEGDTPPDKSTDLIEGFECYVRCDFDGDDVAEWRKVNVAGVDSKRAILSNDEWGDDLPFSDIVPDPMPHRWRGRSLYDTMYDIQRIKTVVLRQTLDNFYFLQNPRQIAVENGIVNPEVLDDFEIGDTIYEKQPNSIRWEQIPVTADKGLSALQYMDDVIEKRTGGAKNAMALDPETLSDQTATAVNAAQTSSFSKIEEYARNIAEYGGLRRVFSKCLKLICKHQDRARTIRLRDEWVDIDPRAWNANMDVTINVGLGSGSRERDLAMLSQIAAKQEQLILNLGVTNPVVGIDKLMDTYRLAVEASGIKPSNRFFPPVSPDTMQQLAQQASQKVDPAIQKAQMQLQADMQKAEHKQQIDQQTAQFNATVAQQKAMFDQQMEHAKAERETALAMANAQRDSQLEAMRLQRESDLSAVQMRTEAAIKQMEANHKAQLANQQFVFDSQLAERKFALDKALKLIDAHVKSQQAQNRPSAS